MISITIITAMPIMIPQSIGRQAANIMVRETLEGAQKAITITILCLIAETIT